MKNKGYVERKKASSQCFLGVKNVWSGQVPKLGLKYWKLKALKLTLHLINVAEINAQQN